LKDPFHPTDEERQALYERFRRVEERRGTVEARLTLLPTGDGGRKGPIASDYRPSWKLGDLTPDGEPLFHDALVVLVGRDALAPGETGEVRLFPLIPESWFRLQPGDVIDMHEGSRLVGRATILALRLREDAR